MRYSLNSLNTAEYVLKYGSQISSTIYSRKEKSQQYSKTQK